MQVDRDTQARERRLTVRKKYIYRSPSASALEEKPRLLLQSRSVVGLVELTLSVQVDI